jgi:heme A synthase
MFFIAVSLALIIFGVMIFLALSPKTGSKIRIAALIALGAMVLSVIAGLVLILAGAGAASGDPVLPDIDPSETPSGGGNWAVLLGFIAFLLALFVIVAVLSLREQKRGSR